MSYEFPFDPFNQTVPNVVTGNNNVDYPTKNTNTLRNPSVSQVAANFEQVVPFSCKADVVNNAIIPFTAQDQTAWDAKLASDLNAQQRASAQAIITSISDQGKVLRATADQLITQLNLHTTWEAAMMSAVAGAATLAALKTAVAAITPVSSVTLAQAKTAILNDVASGNVD